jgi:hypothetical protein
MSVTHRVTGSWAELTADGSVAIPATPQAGDRMYLFARWKDFSVTATVTDWTELVEFADGSSTSGNGTGSVKVACWYRDWQSGDTDPTIDFSANPNNASAVIIVMAKEAADVWLTPVAVTAAMTNWTTSSQSVVASSTTTVLGGGVVMGLIGIRDDTATMTRPTNGIDDSGGLVTWNGNYVEAPATHHSTITGDDGAADLGYRLVTTGAVSVTLRMTGTISAAETGAALWVAQGVEVNLTVANASHGHSAENAVLTQEHNLTVASGSHAHSAASPALTQVHEVAAQPASHAHVAETPALTQLHDLVTQDAAHSHAAESVTVIQAHELVVQGASHDHSSSTPTVAVIHTIDAQDSSHNHSAESLLLTQIHELVVADATHAHIAQSPVVKTISIVFIDPGGDATHSVGHFNTLLPGVAGASYDPTQQVAGAGSYKFDSLTDVNQVQAVRVPGVLGAARRVSTYFWYDSLPDVVRSTTEFVSSIAGSVDYSGGGFATDGDIEADDGTYVTATPAQNSGQGSVFSSFGLSLQPDITILSVKIIYERKYDVDTSIGISRVKWRVNGVEGPNHDNTDMPLTDTVVEVDVTGDQFWEPQHLTDTAFEVIAEARRGDSAIEHTQSWDYVKVVVEYAPATTIMAAVEVDDIAFSLVLVPKGDHGVVRFTEGLALDGSKLSYDGITKLLPDVKNRISFACVSNGSDNLDIKVYVNGIEELSIEGAATNGWAGDPADLYYGWVSTPGVNHICWFNHIFIDDGDDFTDCGNVLSTAKLPAAANENNWNTTGGTGAVNERPLSETNFRQETRASQFRQTYTLEAVDEGDVDLTGKVLRGHMGWAWAKKGSGTLEGIQLVVNGQDFESGIGASLISTTPSLIRTAIAGTAYPSNAAGIGMVSNNETADTFMYECGVVPAYEGPLNQNILLERQEVSNETLGTIIDDLRTDPPDSYELGYIVDEFDGLVTINISTLASEGAQWQAYPTEYSNGSKARFPLPAGIEVRIDVHVTGVTNLMIYKRVNV